MVGVLAFIFSFYQIDNLSSLKPRGIDTKAQ